MNIQDELQVIHHKYGVTEKANYEIQKLFEKYVQEQTEVNKLALGDVSTSVCFMKKCIHYDSCTVKNENPTGCMDWETMC